MIPCFLSKKVQTLKFNFVVVHLAVGSTRVLALGALSEYNDAFIDHIMT